MLILFRRLAVAFTLAGSFIFTSNAFAAMILYDNSTSFLSAAGSVTTESFNDQVNGTSFHTTSLDVGDFTVSMTGSASTSRNYVDAPPPEFSQFDVDGTTILNILTESGVSLFLTFDEAINSFAASLASFNDFQRRTDIYVDGVFTNNPSFSNDVVSFFGVTSDVAFTTIEFRGAVGDGFGMDNVLYSSTSVPEPSAIALMGLGLLGFVAMRRRKSQA